MVSCRYYIVGPNFAVLFVWVIISCITLPIFQWLIRRMEEKQMKEKPKAAGVSLNKV